MRRILKISTMVALMVSAAGVSLSILFGPPVLAGFHGRSARERLLCETDHKALLEACRGLSGRVASGRLKPDSYEVDSWWGRKLPEIPGPIRDLRPKFVTVSDNGVVQVAMTATKWWSLGVFAYPEGCESRSPDYRFGDRRLVEGLWYYDDEYLHDRNYDKEIDAVLRDREKLKKPSQNSIKG